MKNRSTDSNAQPPKKPSGLVKLLQWIVSAFLLFCVIMSFPSAATINFLVAFTLMLPISKLQGGIRKFLNPVLKAILVVALVFFGFALVPTPETTPTTSLNALATKETEIPTTQETEEQGIQAVHHQTEEITESIAPIESETTTPERTKPETTVPETTVPETTVPETTVPETTAPETTVPKVTETEPTEETTVETTQPPTTEAPTQETTKATIPTISGRDYVLNTSSMKIHWPSCRSVEKIKSGNRKDYHGTFEELKAKGYTACGICDPF